MKTDRPAILGVLYVLLLLACSGCVSTHYSRLGESKHGPLPSETSVAVIADMPLLNKIAGWAPGDWRNTSVLWLRHDVVGEIKVVGSPFVGGKRMIRAAQRRARSLGANAILVTCWENPQRGFLEQDYVPRWHVLHAKAVQFPVPPLRGGTKRWGQISIY